MLVRTPKTLVVVRCDSSPPKITAQMSLHPQAGYESVSAHPQFGLMNDVVMCIDGHHKLLKVLLSEGKVD